MSDNGQSILGNPSATGEEIRRALEDAINEALRDHVRTGDPIAVWDWENDCVRIVPPEEIAVPEDGMARADALTGGLSPDA